MCTFFLVVAFRDARFLSGLYGRFSYIVLYHKFTSKLEKAWDVEDEGDVHDLLNVEIQREGNVVSLKQTSYIERLFSEFLPNGIPKCFQSVKTPCDDKLEVTVVAAVAEVNMDTVDPKLRERFQSIVGALNYCVSNTRPDVPCCAQSWCTSREYLGEKCVKG